MEKTNQKGDIQMKETYIPAEMEIIEFEAEDVIRTSGYNSDDELPDIEV